MVQLRYLASALLTAKCSLAEFTFSTKRSSERNPLVNVSNIRNRKLEEIEGLRSFVPSCSALCAWACTWCGGGGWSLLQPSACVCVCGGRYDRDEP